MVWIDRLNKAKLNSNRTSLKKRPNKRKKANRERGCGGVCGGSSKSGAPLAKNFNLQPNKPLATTKDLERENLGRRESKTVHE